MASLRTEITEVVTGLGTLGHDTPEEAMATTGPPAELVNVDSGTWDRLRSACAGRDHAGDFHAALNNGRAFLRATDGLRGRRPLVVEWKGAHRDPGTAPVPADLRIDHVYLVSCKYLSKVLHNSAPAALFDRCLAGPAGRRSTNWFDEVAPAEHQAFYQAVRRGTDGGERLPEKVGDLDGDQQRRLAADRDEASDEVVRAYAELIEAVSLASAQRWRSRLRTPAEAREMLWRLLRLSPAPYFVLGTGRNESLRLRVATPWDWNRSFELRDFEVSALGGGQPVVGWSATVRCRDSGGESEVRGHVEVRWSHGRLRGNPEAKVYLDTPHRDVPGYIPLA